jgi:hypothetical protein
LTSWSLDSWCWKFCNLNNILHWNWFPNLLLFKYRRRKWVRFLSACLISIVILRESRASLSIQCRLSHEYIPLFRGLFCHYCMIRISLRSVLTFHERCTLHNFLVWANLLIDSYLFVKLLQQVTKLLIINRLLDVIVILMKRMSLFMLCSRRTLQNHAWVYWSKYRGWNLNRGGVIQIFFRATWCRKFIITCHWSWYLGLGYFVSRYMSVRWASC